MSAPSAQIAESVTPERDAILASLAKGFARVVLFVIEGTSARVTRTHGVSRMLAGTTVPLIQPTPLRWAIEAASPIVEAGRSPGGQELAAILGVTPPRAFAVIPLVAGKRLTGLAYVDNAGAPFGLGAVAEVFTTCERLLAGPSAPTPERVVMRSTSAREGGRGRKPVPARLVRQKPAIESGEAIWEGSGPLALPPPPPVEALIEARGSEEQGPTTEDREPRTEGREPRTEDREPRTEGREPRTEDREPRTEGREPRTEGREPRTEDREPRTEDREPRTEDRAPRTEDRGPRTEDRAPRTEDRGPHADTFADLRRPTADDDYAIADFLRSLPEAPPPLPTSRPRVAPITFARVRDGERHAYVPQFRPRRLRAAIAAASLVLALGSASTIAALAPLRDAQEEHVLTIAPHASVPQIAAQLEEAGLVRHAKAFEALVRVTGIDRQLRAGTYRLSSGAWPWQLAEELKRGQVEMRTITIPEGLTLEEVAQTFESAGLLSAQEFLEAAAAPELRARYRIDAPTLQGYLFPETYRLARGLTASHIVELMVQLFFERLATIPGAGALTPAELRDRVTLASIVERESKNKSEAARIAGVFQNRLDRGMRLESCATVQYILGEAKPRLTLADVRQPSPFNTYLNEGLPPGPIANPGERALAAALAPERHDYLFFVARDDASGRHHFSTSYEEHQRIQRLMRR